MVDAVSFYFHVHQPLRLRKFSIYNDSQKPAGQAYFDEYLNRDIFMRATKKCYLPATKLVLENLVEYDGAFKVAYSITGVWLEHAKRWAMPIVDLFRELFDTGHAEVLGETYYHSLSSLYEDKGEFKEQVKSHREFMKNTFGQEPRVFRNTEAIYDNPTAKIVEELGFRGYITEGASHILDWRSPNYVYRNKDGNMSVILRNFKLSDDIAFRFSTRSWPEWPLTADKFADWVKGCPGEIVNVYVDYETFGEHQWPETGIHDFLQHLPGEILRRGMSFVTPSETVQRFQQKGEIDVPHAISWADEARDVSTWLGNQLQHQCFRELMEMEWPVKNRGDGELLHVWRLLQTSDHLYYLSTKTASDGEVHKYFSPYGTPYDAFVNYINIIRDFKRRVDGK